MKIVPALSETPLVREPAQNDGHNRRVGETAAEGHHKTESKVESGPGFNETAGEDAQTVEQNADDNTQADLGGVGNHAANNHTDGHKADGEGESHGEGSAGGTEEFGEGLGEYAGSVSRTLEDAGHDARYEDNPSFSVEFQFFLRCIQVSGAGYRMSADVLPAATDYITHIAR